MKTADLHEEFLNILFDKIPKKNIVNSISDMLKLEKDAAYRRLCGKVNFSVREMGIIADKMGISLDQLIHKGNEMVWMPFSLRHPVKMGTMDIVFDMIDSCFERMARSDSQTGEMGNIYTTLPMEYYLYSPVLTKFMFFKWGHYFVGTDEFNDYANWTPPSKLNGLLERLKAVYNFDKTYYIIDDSLISSLAKEICYFHRMHIITAGEMEEIKDALKDMLTKLEQCLSGLYIPTVGIAREAAFYVCPMPLGFTSNYFLSENIQCIIFQTNFNFCMIEDNRENFFKLKEWVDSFRGISTMLSRSGRIERRLFFKSQHEVLDYILG